MKKLLAFLLLSFLLFSQTASANYQPVYAGQLTDRGTSALTTSSLLVVPANSARKYLVIQNVGSVNVGCNPGGTAAIGSKGTITLVPNGSWSFEANYIYTGAINCIAASSSGNVVTAWEGQ